MDAYVNGSMGKFDNEYFSIDDTECVAKLLMNRAFNKFELEDVRKLAAELCGRIHPYILFPIVSSQLKIAANAHDLLKIKACLFSICTSLVVKICHHYEFIFCFIDFDYRGRDSVLPPVISRITETIETVLLWPSMDGDEVSKAQHGCIDCLALMVCTELQALELFNCTWNGTSIVGEDGCSGSASARNSVHTYVIHQLTCDKNEFISSGREKSEANVPLPFRLCMANVLISACQKISNSGRKPFAQKTLPCLIQSVGVAKEPEIRAACIQVLFSAVYHLKTAILPYSSNLLKVSLKSLREGSDK
ncbi:unnamed protein product, partial [Ilex paraguariensis]